MKVLIVDDESMAVRRLERLTHRIVGEGAANIACADNLADARVRLRETSFDLVLLDLNLAGDDGFSLLEEHMGGAAIVVVSAHPDRAIEAYQHAVLDFVPKPVNEERLSQAIARARQVWPRRGAERLLIRSQTRAEFVDLSAIMCVSGADDYCEILLANGRTILCERRLTDLERALPQDMFLRVHRSHVINLRHVESVDLRAARPVARLRAGVERPISRRRLSVLRSRL